MSSDPTDGIAVAGHASRLQKEMSTSEKGCRPVRGETIFTLIDMPDGSGLPPAALTRNARLRDGLTRRMDVARDQLEACHEDLQACSDPTELVELGRRFAACLARIHGLMQQGVA